MSSLPRRSVFACCSRLLCHGEEDLSHAASATNTLIRGRRNLYGARVKLIRCITRQMGLQITDDADIARDDRGGTCKMAGGGETRPPSLPAVSWSSHMSPNKCAPFAGVELLPTPPWRPHSPSADPREPWRWRDGGKRGREYTHYTRLGITCGSSLGFIEISSCYCRWMSRRCLKPPPRHSPPGQAPSPPRATHWADLTFTSYVCGFRCSVIMMLILNGLCDVILFGREALKHR